MPSHFPGLVFILTLYLVWCVWQRRWQKSQLPHWLIRAEALIGEDHVNDALDLVYDQIDELCQRGKFDEVDDILRLEALLDLNTDILLSIVTVTYSYRSHLPSRSTLCARARGIFRARGENAEELLKGWDAHEHFLHR